MITLNLNPELENKIREEANLKGLSVEQYLNNLIEENLNKTSNNYPLKGSVIYYEDPFSPAVSPEEWGVLS